MYRIAPQAKVEIDALADSLAQEFSGSFVNKTGLKGRTRTLQKVTEDYNGDFSKIGDVARNTLVVPQEQMADALARVSKIPGAKIKHVPANELGYSGINVKVPTSVGMTAEMQINTPLAIFAKEKEALGRQILGDAQYDAIAKATGKKGGLGHEFYERYRVLKRDDPKREAIAAESRNYYASLENGDKPLTKH